MKTVLGVRGACPLACAGVAEARAKEEYDEGQVCDLPISTTF